MTYCALFVYFNMMYLYDILRLAFLILFLFFGRFECLSFSPPTLPNASSSPSPSLAKPLEIIKIHVHVISHAHHMYITCRRRVHVHRQEEQRVHVRVEPVQLVGK